MVLKDRAPLPRLDVDGPEEASDSRYLGNGWIAPQVGGESLKSCLGELLVGHWGSETPEHPIASTRRCDHRGRTWIPPEHATEALLKLLRILFPLGIIRSWPFRGIEV